ncbi:hypothetical protein FEE96_20360 [Parasedimentitalea maritima]|uniref:Uncharacterized protein n=1 Tax=Parasedimentitalea maritima TaxID=2578117 RepID=A0ABY2UPN0_9RHOB|nr:hypothetical protein [Zongyanglinia marina]TLP56798.1 hypothetical protein FEE96_20360 [Zongyanglinia marina]
MTELTSTQLTFLANYLHVVPSAGMFKRKKAKQNAEIEHNEKVKQDYQSYLEKKAEVDSLLDAIRAMLGQCSQALKSIPKGQVNAEVLDFRETVVTLTKSYTSIKQAVDGIHVSITNADSENPEFEQGRRSLETHQVNLVYLKAKIPDQPKLIEDGTIGVLFKKRTEIQSLKQFEDTKLLSESIVRLELPDEVAERQRSQALADHDLLCRKCRDRIDAMIVDAQNPDKASLRDSLVSSAGDLVEKLKGDRQPIIDILINAINGHAHDKIAQLMADGSPVAAREMQRTKIITESLKTLNRQTDALTLDVTELRVAFADAKPGVAKREAAAAFHEAQAQLDELVARKRRLEAYEALMAQHAAKIAEAESELWEWFEDPVETVTNLLADPETKLRPPGEPSLEMLVGNGGMYFNQANQYETDRKRVVLDAKLFPDEEEITYLDEDQFNILMSIIDEGKKLAEAGKNPEAEFAFIKARSLHQVFRESARMALPPAQEPPLSEIEKLNKQLASFNVELDRFWGRGGDEQNTLRTQLKKIAKARDIEVAKDVPDVASIQAHADNFDKALAQAIAAYVPQQRDQLARDRAQDAKNEILQGLLSMYNTKELQEAQLADVPSDKLLVIEQDGVTKYFEIKTERGGTQDKVSDKHIPREAMDLLLEQATMLELLAQSQSPDCFAEIEAAVAKGQADLAAISKGGPDYDYVAKQVKECTKLLAAKRFSSWVPDGLYELKVEFENFKDNYITGYLPAKAKLKVDELHAALEAKKVEATALSKAYDKAEIVVKRVEAKLAGGKKAPKPNLADQLRDLIKKGPGALMLGYTSAPGELKEADALLARMKKALEDIGPALESDGLEGEFKSDINTARQTLETKSETGIRTAKAKAEAIEAKIDGKMAEFDPSSNGLKALEDFAKFLEKEAKGASDRKAAVAEFESGKEKVEASLKHAAATLEKEKSTLASYTEYKNVYDAMKAQFDATKKITDPVQGVAQIKPQISSAKQLDDELQNLSVIKSGKATGPDFPGWEDALKTKMENISQSASNVADSIIDKAKYKPSGVAEEDKALEELKDAAADVAGTLRLVTYPNFKKILTLDKNIAVEAAAALADTNTVTRKKALALVREKALAEVRRIRTEMDAHPALKVYRGNPFSNKSWDGFASALHGFDVDVLTKLQPA